MKRFAILLTITVLAVSAAMIPGCACGEEAASAPYPIEGEWLLEYQSESETTDLTFDAEGNVYYTEYRDEKYKVCRNGEIYKNDTLTDETARFEELSEDAFLIGYTKDGYTYYTAFFKVKDTWYRTGVGYASRYLFRFGSIFPNDNGGNDETGQYFFDGPYLYIIRMGKYTRYELVPYGDSAFALVTCPSQNRFIGYEESSGGYPEYFVIRAD